MEYNNILITAIRHKENIVGRVRRIVQTRFCPTAGFDLKNNNNNHHAERFRVSLFRSQNGGWYLPFPCLNKQYLRCLPSLFGSFNYLKIFLYNFMSLDLLLSSFLGFYFLNILMNCFICYHFVFIFLSRILFGTFQCIKIKFQRSNSLVS